jgi:hypothetical protein
MILDIGFEDVDWVHLAQPGVKFRTIVKTVMNFHIYIRRGISWLVENTKKES